MIRLRSAATTVAIGLTFLLIVLNLSFRQIQLSYQLSTFKNPEPKTRNAFCVFLAEPNEAIKDHDEDYYFVGTRMLIYQLLHDPSTRSNASIDFVVLVTSNVPRWKWDLLLLDGAIVQVVDPINIDWIKPGRPRWAHVMDKLNVFRLTQYEKILLLDTDMVVMRPLDGVFEDSAGALRTNLNNPENTKADEAPQPNQYVMAGNAGPGPHEGYTRERHGRLNAGFVVFKPSMEMYEHYMSVARIEGRFPGGSPEQDLWNYVHRKEGNMPWYQLDPDWTTNSPTYEDWEHGVAAIHEKYWRCRDAKLKEVLMKSRWKTEGFWSSYSRNVADPPKMDFELA